MAKGLDLTNLYQLRNDFVVIGLTGRTCSGVTTIANHLKKGFDNGNGYPAPLTEFKHNSYRKYNIIYRYAKENLQPFDLIKYRDVIYTFIIQSGFESFVSYLGNSDLINLFKASKLSVECDFTKEIELLQSIKEEFNKFSIQIGEIDFERITEGENYLKLSSLFKSTEYSEFCETLSDNLKLQSLVKRNKLLQIISNNLRCSGNPFLSIQSDSNAIFTIAERIKHIVKALGDNSKDGKTRVVIDSLRNPLEVMYFKQRYAAFYLFSINRENEILEKKLKEKYGEEFEDVSKLLKEEYKGGKEYEFHLQNVSDCIQKADIHITYRTQLEVMQLNQEKESEKSTPYFTWEMQLLKFLSLISHPGLVPPSPEERCMQLAYTAKYNSGCISRQVGAAITDEFYSIKAIGWNNTPEGQVPCSLRNVEDLLNSTGDLESFTPYEKENEKFRKELEKYFQEGIEKNRDYIKGRNVCFCFKSIQNSCAEGKNQVHTRSLHAEESAFLQITKYGGEGIKGGKLFTTASPCELCSKKAYQLGIKVIYYIDPYPGISEPQILKAGQKSTRPIVRLFNGAIGNAYHWLYEPFMAQKDELAIILGHKFITLTEKLENDLATKETTIAAQEATIKNLQVQLAQLTKERFES
jgi:dCMP deaminase